MVYKKTRQTFNFFFRNRRKKRSAEDLPVASSEEKRHLQPSPSSIEDSAGKNNLHQIKTSSFLASVLVPPPPPIAAAAAADAVPSEEGDSFGGDGDGPSSEVARAAERLRKDKHKVRRKQQEHFLFKDPRAQKVYNVINFKLIPRPLQQQQ